MSRAPIAFLPWLLLACTEVSTATDATPNTAPDAGPRADAATPIDSGAPDAGHTDAAGRVALHSGSAGGTGNLDGPRRDARFGGPSGVVRAADGTVYVADTSNYTIRRIGADGMVTTLAGTPGVEGTADGTGAAARFLLPTAIVIDADGNLIVSDSYAGTLRKVTPAGVVTTWAGRAGDPRTADGPRAQARFRGPEGLAFDADGNLFVADRDAHTIRRITPAGEVSTWIGADLTPGSTDGPRATARLDSPFGVAIGPGDVLAIADSGNNVIRWVDANGVVSTLAGTAGEGQDTADGTGPAARFGRPRALAFDTNGVLIVADTFNDRLRHVTAAGVVTTWAGTTAGAIDGPRLQAKLSFPTSLAFGGGTLYFTDTGSSIVRMISGDRVETFGGTAVDVEMKDGPLTEARYFGASGMLLRPDGTLLVADTHDNAIRAVTSSGAVTTIAGSPAEAMVVDGPLAIARFQSPRSFLALADGGYLVADTGNNRIRKVSAAGEVSTFAGGENMRGQTHVDGPLLDARFFAPATMVADSTGVIYVTDAGNHAVRRIGTDGMVSTLAGSGLPGYIDGPGGDARFNGPDGLLLLDDRTLIVADALNSVLRRIAIQDDGTAVVSLFVGARPVNDEPRPGSFDGRGAVATFYTPRGLLRVGDAILVADSNNNLVRRVTLADGDVTTVAGTRGRYGIAPGPLPGTLFEPQSMLRLPSGEVLVSSFGAIVALYGL